MPNSFDYSTSEYFPPIGNQSGQNSCNAWANGYYQFTFAMNKQLDKAATEENAAFPKRIYNFINSSGNLPTHLSDTYIVTMNQGCAPMSMVPYDEDYHSWATDEKVWREALNYRLKSWQYFGDVGTASNPVTSAYDSDLNAIKTALINGDLLTFSTYSQNKSKQKLKTHSSVPENDKYAGEAVYTYSIYNQVLHRMTIVGYNDNIWVDVNDNGEVYNGEMGAFKIADSAGT